MYYHILFIFQLYADFYASDIIIASPLGLRELIGTEGEEQRDYDFLASIEILIMDQAQVFSMQVNTYEDQLFIWFR